MNALIILAATLGANLSDELDKWDDTGVDVNVTRATCRDENAYYFPSLQLVVICKELDDKPEVQRFVFNHEMGHAWMFQHGVPNSERGADEIAAMMSSYEDTLAAAHWFAGMAKGSSGDDGEHQAHADRAASLFCLAYGFHKPELTTPLCRMYADSVVEHWERTALMAD